MMARWEMLLSPGTMISVSSLGARLTRKTSELMADFRELRAPAQETTPVRKRLARESSLSFCPAWRKNLPIPPAIRRGFQEEFPATLRPDPPQSALCRDIRRRQGS